MKTCATPSTCRCWGDINFKLAEESVKKLQRRVAQAYREHNFKKVTALQHKLLHSYYSKAVAIRRVTSNKGRNTSGIDNTIWATSEDKFTALSEMTLRGYKPQPLKRIYIPKSNGNKRPLSIPTIKDRAVQTLYGFTIYPIEEETADENSYAYRIGIGARDAVKRCIDNMQSRDYTYVLKTDIKVCFDNISHKWLIEHVPINKHVLNGILKCGYIFNNHYYATERGVPQGGCLSGILCNMALNGLERVILDNTEESVCYIRYADDVLIFSNNIKTLHTVKPLIESFLAERGLCLSEEKTAVYSKYDGFQYLGFDLKMNSDNVEALPTQKNIESLYIKFNNTINNSELTKKEAINKAIRILRGWLSYYKGLSPDYVLVELEDFLSELYSYQGLL